MRSGVSIVFAVVASLSAFAAPLAAQDLGPQFRRIKDGIYVQSARETNSNAGIIVTSEGVVLVDSGHNPTDSRAVMEAVKKLTPLPVRFLIDTEVHADHTTGHYLFSPPAVIINHAGAGAAMRQGFVPDRMPNLIKQSPERAAAAEGYRMVPPQVEYRDKLTIHLGGKTIEVLYLKNVHSEADSAVWLPEERVLFSASVAVPNQVNILRPFVTIPDMLSAMKMLKGLNPEVVIPGHGTPGTTKIFDDSEQYYALLMERVGALARAGKTLDQIKAEAKMPEYSSWSSQERMPTNIEAAYRALPAGNR
jgi:cyclase